MVEEAANPNGINGNRHQGFEHLNKGNRQVNVSGVREPEAERVKSTDGDNGGEIKLSRHGNGLDDFEDFDEEESKGGTERHVNHDDDGEAEEDPDCNIGVREKDLLDDAVAQRPALAHCV
ncbi:hypothetical protein GOBAR_AA35227 [Gossypium barbadense]|uniref:Uncharacterized protein n=1 Tax=Gossypium barbadense TaxID=3634 RepID=A0A2P5W347_GOSBA|nr:hypothetical protein GOBAR_AA35227 [Gossypium barbadense]